MTENHEQLKEKIYLMLRPYGILHAPKAATILTIHNLGVPIYFLLFLKLAMVIQFL